jgi:hypothetical protein
MLLIIVVVWAVLVVGICAVCAAGGVADDVTEELYADMQQEKDGEKGGKRDAA